MAKLAQCSLALTLMPKLTNTTGSQAHGHRGYVYAACTPWEKPFTFGAQFALANVTHILLGTLFIGCTHKFLSLHNPFTKLIWQKFGKDLAKWILSGSYLISGSNVCQTLKLLSMRNVHLINITPAFVFVGINKSFQFSIQLN